MKFVAFKVFSLYDGRLTEARVEYFNLYWIMHFRVEKSNIFIPLDGWKERKYILFIQYGGDVFYTMEVDSFLLIVENENRNK